MTTFELAPGSLSRKQIAEQMNMSPNDIAVAREQSSRMARLREERAEALGVTLDDLHLGLGRTALEKHKDPDIASEEAPGLA